ncbi:DUF1048 domain-containing protein [Rhodococcus sp. NPDC058521]|uniref:DUF1048 domain-containing protein n=1 Tax=Rhodococcus sp. NPDC058521 TaxID=3346536 RepID=UPI0036603239
MTMKTLIERITGGFADKRRWREYKARVAALPLGYRTAAGALERYLMYFGPSGEPDSLLSMLADLAELFEQSAADGISIRDVVGADPVEFAEEFLRNYEGSSWVEKERQRLTSAITRAESEDRP